MFIGAALLVRIAFMAFARIDSDEPQHLHVARLPRDRVLTEPDGPYIQAGTGQAMNPGDNVPGGPALRPGQLSNTEQQLAEIWGESADVVRQRIWQNLAELESRVELRPFGAAEMLATV